MGACDSGWNVKFGGDCDCLAPAQQIHIQHISNLSFHIQTYMVLESSPWSARWSSLDAFLRSSSSALSWRMRWRPSWKAPITSWDTSVARFCCLIWWFNTFTSRSPLTLTDSHSAAHLQCMDNLTYATLHRVITLMKQCLFQLEAGSILLIPRYLDHSLAYRVYQNWFIWQRFISKRHS